MNQVEDPRNPGLRAGRRLGEYQVQRVLALAEIDALYYELIHLPTGARHIHLSSSDPENTFSVAFKTVPADSSGVAHILEHTVLCGSRKYPVRDPFFSMLKRSLSTFMNAFTASDWTMYPFATQNTKDYYNLMDVYLDATFFPNLEELNFKQEGHRLELAEEPGEGGREKLEYKGVVYNEMKGAMSSPDQVMVRSLLNALYPSTTYRFNSGGDPAVIPALTYAQLKAFHRRHYHPSNAYFYTYGNLPLEAHLNVIQERVLKNFKAIDPRTEVPSQPRWAEPKTVSYTYPLGKTEDPHKKCQACVAWLTADIQDSFEVLVLTLLEQVLLGNAASPLRKALIDSGLGAALSDGSGYDAENRDTLFACGLKEVREADAGQIEAIVFDVLNTLCREGIDPELIAAAIHQIEFHRKEVTNAPYPYGIKLLLSFSGGWLHGGDPLRSLQFDADLQKLHDALAQGPFFENRIRRYFLDNPHRVLFTLKPDQTQEARENERVRAELDALRAGLGADDLARIEAQALALRALQEQKEDLSSLPTLEREDIPPSVQVVQPAAHPAETAATCYVQPTSGIFYLTAVCGVGGLEKRLVPLVPFFCHAFSRIGTTRRDYSEMARRIDACTGGVGLGVHARTRFEPGGACLPFVTFDAKCLVRNLERMFDLVREMIGEFDFSDQTRLKNILLEYRAALEAGIIHSGHRLAISLASRNFSQANTLGETWHGIHQFKTIKALSDDLSPDRLASLAGDLTAIGRSLWVKENLRVALIGETEAVSRATALARDLRQGLGDGPPPGFTAPDIQPARDVPREGWSIASAVSFVARTFQTVRMEHADAPALAVIAKILRSMYLHREIREKGGAYGGFALYSAEDGLFSCASYRDPHIAGTLKAFDGAAAFIRSGDFSAEDIKEAILQVCAEIDKPDSPGQAARKAFYRGIIALSDEARSRFKGALLELDRARVLQAAEKYFGPAAAQAVAVISSEAALQAANVKLKDNPLKLYPI